MDGERRHLSGTQSHWINGAEDPQRPDPDLLHSADVPLHVGEQAHGGHRPGRRPPVTQACAPLGAVHARLVAQGGSLPVLLFAAVLSL